MATRKSSSKKRPSAKKTPAKKTARKAPAKRKASARKTTSRNQAAETPPPPPARLGNQGGVTGVPANFHALYDRGFRASRGIAPAAAPKTTTGHRRLARSVTGLDVQYDSATQNPKLVMTQQPAARLTRRAPGTAESAVMDFVRSRSDLWNLSGGDTGTIEVTSVSEPRGEASADVPAAPPAVRRRGAARGAAAAPADDSTFNVRNLQTVNLIQRIDGKEVFNSDVSAAVDRNNQVIAVSGQFFPGASSQPARRRAAAAPAAAAPEEEAIARAVFDLTGVAYEAGDFTRAAADSGPYRIYEYKPAAKNDPRPMLERPVRLKDVMFPLGEGQFVAAYYMEIWIRGFPAFAYIFDAVDTPDLLYRKNLTAHIAFSYRVHNTGDAVMRPHDGPAPGTPHPKGTPNGFQAKPVKEKLIKVDSLLPGDSWLPADAKTTDGNNCIAYADLSFPDGLNDGDVLGKVTSARKFDYTYNHKKKASDPKNLQNSLVGMFFHVNWLHDRWYEAGFDEASGNAQKDNFGRGGIDGDPILAEGNDFEGTDNANMSTPADGSSPRMQMYEFTGTSPITRTSNHEALITFHEMGHYITNRLVGNANGLFNTQGGAMGEGWGDFFAICMTSQATDDFAKGVFAAGGWTDLTPDFKDNYYFSIRRYPYSADMTKNPLTFKHISNNVVLPTGPAIQASAFGNNEIHNAGEVWCSMLWEVFVNLVAKHGHAEAEKRMLAYVIGGLKLTPPDPTFINARDGILSAVSAISPTDLPEVKAGFAKRGIGAGAVAPPSDSESLAGVVESFVP